MNELEDRLRDAYRAAGGTVRPEAVRELRVRPSGAARGRPRWMGALMPLGAAAVVAALVLGVFVIVHGTVGAAGAGKVTTASGGREHAAPLPEFTVKTEGSGLQVVRTATGQVSGQIAAPAGQEFAYVAAAGDDRTFLVAADLNPQTSCRTILYQVRLSDSGRPSAPAGLPVSIPANRLPTALAVSADGRTAAFLAVRCATGSGHIGNTQAIGDIELADLGTGQVTRHWSYTLGEDYPSSFSLSADGSRLAFTQILNGTLETVARLLPTGAPSGTVDSVSRVLLRPRGSNAGVALAVLSPDGGTLYACTQDCTSPGAVGPALAAYSTATGRQIGVLHTWPANTSLDAVSMDPSGRYLLTYLVRTTRPATRIRTSKGGFLFKPAKLTTTVIAVNLASGRVSPLPIRITDRMGMGGIAW